MPDNEADIGGLSPGKENDEARRKTGRFLSSG
jgi:hypothetical protein